MSVMVDREVEAARALLARYCDTYPLADDAPVPVDDIAESLLGLLVRLAPLEEGVSGILLLRQREIRVNSTECERWPARRRFTVAHEIGHWELHASEVEEGFICRFGDVREEQPDKGSPEQVREREANRFAAELLMPESRVRARVGAVGVQVPELADEFDVSALAMAWRLHNLEYITQRPNPQDYGVTV